jgi:glutathione S-transferase
VAQNMGECFELIEREMVRGPFVLGDALSTCDLYLFTIVQWLPGDGVDVSRFPKVAQIAKAVKELPSTARVLPA